MPRSNPRLLALSVLLLALALAGPASAATVSSDGTTVRYVDLLGVPDSPRLGATRAGTDVTVDVESRYSISAGAGCSQVEGDRVQCTLAEATARILLELGPGNDHEASPNTSGLPTRYEGGSGIDHVHGQPASGAPDTFVDDDEGMRVDYASRAAPLDISVGSGADDGEQGEFDDVGAGVTRLDGGRGDDFLSAEGAAGPVSLLGGLGDDDLLGGDDQDALDGEEGEDVLAGGLAGDRLEGGPDLDLVTYFDRTSALDVSVAEDLGADADDGAAGEGDDVREDVEGVLGGAGPDRLRSGTGFQALLGGAGADDLDAGDGDDQVEGGAGVDTLRGGAGDDLVQARDGEAEDVDCGAGEDLPELDGTDRAVGCEVSGAGQPRRPSPGELVPRPVPVFGGFAVPPGYVFPGAREVRWDPILVEASLLRTRIRGRSGKLVVRYRLGRPGWLEIRVERRTGRRFSPVGAVRTAQDIVGMGRRRLVLEPKVAGKRLRPGAYRLVLRAAGGAERSAPRRLAFTIVR